VGGHVHVLLQAADLAGAEAVLLDQAVLGKLFVFHGFPQTVITNHRLSSLRYYPYLDCNTEKGETQGNKIGFYLGIIHMLPGDSMDMKR
jgi:hypothetical protein